MSSSEENTNSQPENNRSVQINLNNYINILTNIIKFRGYIDDRKSLENVRILTLNPRGINLWKSYKIDMFLNTCKKHQVDIILLSETQVKWTPANLDRMENQFRTLGKDIKIIGLDSRQWDINKKDYLPGRILSVFGGKSRALLQDHEVYTNEIGNWMAVKLRHKNKTLGIINVYRILAMSSSGNTCSLTQYNLAEGQTKLPASYRKEILSQIRDYVHKNEDIDDIIIAGDFNQNITSSEIQVFFREIGVLDVHSHYNNIPLGQMDTTYIQGKTPIDSIALSCGAISYVEGVKLMEYNEFVMTDHRGYLLDINFEDYFNNQFSG